MLKRIDVIVPVKDEADNVGELIQRIDASLRKVQQKYKIIFIDDHSTDKTFETITKLSQKYPVNVYTKKGKAGKAFSILEGANIATSEFVVTIDGDLQYPPEALPAMLHMTNEYDVIVAKRQSRHDPFSAA